MDKRDLRIDDWVNVDNSYVQFLEQMDKDNSNKQDEANASIMGFLCILEIRRNSQKQKIGLSKDVSIS